jgi:hypothetical protein
MTLLPSLTSLVMESHRFGKIPWLFANQPLELTERFDYLQYGRSVVLRAWKLVRAA